MISPLFTFASITNLHITLNWQHIIFCLVSVAKLSLAGKRPGASSFTIDQRLSAVMKIKNDKVHNTKLRPMIIRESII